MANSPVDDRLAFQACCAYLDTLFPETGEDVNKTVAPVTIRALLLRTDGEYGIVKVRGSEDFGLYIDGYIETIDVVRGYYNPWRSATVKPRIRCYANIEGSQPSPWSNVVNVIRGAYTPIFGNILLMSESLVNGNDADIDPYIVDVVERYAKCTDEASFLTVLYRYNHGGDTRIVVVPDDDEEVTVTARL